MTRLICVLVVAALLVLPSAAAACPKTSVADLEDEVMCPVCGTTLGLATEAPQAQRERAFVQRLVRACKSKAQIKAALAAELGPSVLALPERRGFSLAAYLVPLLALAAAGGALALATVQRRRRAHPLREPYARPSPDPAKAARLEADLERYGR